MSLQAEAAPEALSSPSSPDQPAASPSQLWLGVIAGVVGVGLLIAVVLWGTVFSPGHDDLEAIEDTARDYLTALADGDAERALSLAVTVPADDRWLTAEGLAELIAAHPVTDISVAETSYEGSGGQAVVDYRLGDREVNARLDLTQSDSGWLLNQATSQVVIRDLAGRTSGQLSLLGQSVATTEAVDLFPGIYQWGFNHPWVYINNPELVVPQPEQVIEPEPLNYGLVDEAQPTLQQAAQATLDACLEEEAFSPSAHCGFGFSRTEDGTTVDDFTWSILSGNLDQLTFTPSATDPLQVTAPITVALHGEGLASNGSRYQGDQTLTLVTADVTDPAAVSISFSRT